MRPISGPVADAAGRQANSEALLAILEAIFASRTLAEWKERLAQARGAMRCGETETKGRAIGRAVRIVEEGLRAGLNLNAGGRLASDLNQLYSYVGMRLTQANLRNDETLLDECLALMQPLQEAWTRIAPTTGGSNA